MIGMIATGHGSFATGITSGLKLLAGEPQDYEIFFRRIRQRRWPRNWMQLMRGCLAVKAS